MSANEIILYDLPSKGHCVCWSPAAWKARAALNYKRLPYKTQWTEYPDLAPTFKSLGLPPNDPSASPFAYSCPAATMPSGKPIMDSRAIAEALEDIQPEPSLHLKDKTGAEYADRAAAAVTNTVKPLMPMAIPRVPDMILREPSMEYFLTTREMFFGMPLNEVAKSEQAGETAWQGARQGIEELKQLVKENGGPFIMGKDVSFADFVVAGLWAFLEKLDRDGDLLGRLMKEDGLAAHREACKPWFERADR